MSRSILFVIDADPRVSGRPAEAVRIAAGIGAWNKVTVSLYLRGFATLMLAEDIADLVDSDNYERYLPSLSEPGSPIYVQNSSSFLAQAKTGRAAYQEISDQKLADLAAKHSQVIRF
jgi:hypothetical protein